MSVYNRSGTLIAETQSTSSSKPLNGLKLSLLGDSISAYRGYVPEGNHYYYNGSKENVTSVNQMWWKILCDDTGMTPLIIDAWNGTGITFLDHYEQRTEMSSDLRCGRLHSGNTKPDIILIAGGVNDYTYAEAAKNEPLSWDGLTTPVITNSFTEAYACMIQKLRTNYPSALVVALSTWFTLRGDPTGEVYQHTITGTSRKYSQADYNSAIESVANILRAPFIRVDNIGINRQNIYPTFAQDSSEHPAHANNKGQALMGKYLASVLPVVAKSWGEAN